MIEVRRPSRCKISSTKFLEIEKEIKNNYILNPNVVGGCGVCGGYRVMAQHKSKVDIDSSLKRYRWYPCSHCLKHKSS